MEAPENIEEITTQMAGSKQENAIPMDEKTSKIENPSYNVDAAVAKTRKHLTELKRHQACQQRLLGDAPTQVRQRLAGRMNNFMEAVVLPNGLEALGENQGNLLKRKPRLELKTLIQRTPTKKMETRNQGNLQEEWEMEQY